jgi:hypothetical protein
MTHGADVKQRFETLSHHQCGPLPSERSSRSGVLKVLCSRGALAPSRDDIVGA